jgi:hypothetical protein
MRPDVHPDDPLMLYEYACWVATEGGMLRSMVINHAKGQTQLSQQAANLILEYYALNAHRSTSVSPRAIEMSAKSYLDLGDPIRWRAEQDSQLLPTPRWKLPAKLYQYRVDWRRTQPKAEPHEADDDPDEEEYVETPPGKHWKWWHVSGNEGFQPTQLTAYQALGQFLKLDYNDDYPIAALDGFITTWCDDRNENWSITLESIPAARGLEAIPSIVDDINAKKRANNH